MNVYGVTSKCMCTESPVCVCVCTESRASEGWPITYCSEHRNKGSCSVTREEVIDRLKLVDCQLLQLLEFFDTES
jgi:hypothetical protein